MPSRALLVIDLLNDFLDQWDEDDRSVLLSLTNQLIDHFRGAGLPIFWVRQEFEPDLGDAFLEMRKKDIRVTVRGTAGAEIHAELRRHETDQVIVEKRHSAFFRTHPETILERHGIDELTLAGINTHACIRMTAIDAYQRDFEVVIASDCVGSYDKRHEEMSLEYLDGKIAEVKSNSEIMSAISIS